MPQPRVLEHPDITALDKNNKHWGVALERLQNVQSYLHVDAMKDKENAAALNRQHTVISAGMNADSSINAHAKALGRESREGVRSAKATRCAFDDGQIPDLVREVYLRTSAC